MKTTKNFECDGLTWLWIHGTRDELDRCSAWIASNRTMYVIESARTFVEEISLDELRNRIRGVNLLEQRFGFKSKNDALRFKLSI